MKRIQNFFISIFFLFAILWSFSRAKNFSDTFDSGIDTTWWSVISDDSLFSFDDSNGDVHFVRKEGGSINNIKIIRLQFKAEVYGNFNVAVDFRNAYINRVNGSPGNQVQLNLNFGGQAFSMVRSDESSAGHNVHVWINPPAQWRGEQLTSDSSGTLRVTRSGNVVSGFFNDDSIFSDTFNDALLQHISFSLQNNRTTDSTAVTFDNFVLLADSVEDIVSNLDNQKSRPASFKLVQNYPNPFNPTTMINYTIGSVRTQHAVPPMVNLTIYNLLGQKIVTLVDGSQNTGSYQVIFDGRGLPSGIYFYRLTTSSGFSKTRKMVLVR